jgi:hypothetical protein
MLCEELSHCGHEFAGDLHDGLSRFFEGGFVLCNCLFLGLLPVMRNPTPRASARLLHAHV